LFSQHTVELTNIIDPNTAVSAFYLSGSSGVVSNPVEPTLPLELVNVTAADNILRGAGFRGGSYTDLADILPLSGAPTTEIRGVHAPFLTDVFYPVQPWRINYFEALADPAAGTTRLAITPAQFLSNTDGTLDGTLRRYDSLDFRLYYNNNVDTFANNSIPALAAPPTIARVTAVPDNGTVHFTMEVVSNPASGVQEVWVTYTAVNGPTGVWQSFDLTQHPTETTLWEGSLDLAGTDPLDVRYMVQAANGVGLVSLATNLGAYYIPGVTASGGEPTELAFTNPPTTGAYGSQAMFTVVLSQNGTAVANQPVTIGLGPQTRLAMTNMNGEATVSLSLLGVPGEYDAKASFAGSVDFAASTTTAPFTIVKQDTVLTLDQPAGGFAEEDALLTATLTDANGRVLGEKTVFFVVSSPDGAVSEAVITDYAGRAVVGNLTTLPPGTYIVNTYFGGSIPLHTGETVTYFDERYHPAQTSGVLELLNHTPAAHDDLYTVDEDNTLIVGSASGVLSNDSDDDGDALTAVLISPPDHGQVVLNSDGGFTYVPDANFNGTDSFGYAASDGLDSSTAAVTIMVHAVNDAPTAVDDSYSLDQDTSLTVTAPGVLANDADVDGDAITAVLNAAPSHGNLTLNPDGSFTYTPFPGFYGQDSFTYHANDSSLNSDAAAVTLTVNFVNAPPVCSDARASVDSIWPANKELYPVTVLGVTDADGQPLIITITSIYQDEPVGKGSHSPDGFGVGTDTAYVRAERDGNGNGRVYHIYFTADDSRGGLCSGEIIVPIVPHDQSGDAANIDDGPLYDSTIPD
jgi:VCBS repeat-containing protein